MNRCWTLLLLLLPSAAFAADWCAASCDAVSDDVLAGCPKGETCTTEADDAWLWCIGQCDEPYRVLGVDELASLALAEVQSELGTGWSEIDRQLYQGADDADYAWMFVFSADTKQVPDRGTVVESLREGKDPVLYDGLVAGVSMGARLELPPVVAMWTGVPLEYLAQPKADAEIERLYSPKSYSLTGRFGDPVFPVFTYDVDGTTVWQEPRGGALAEGVKLTQDDALRATDAYQVRLERMKRAWRAAESQLSDK